MQYYHGFKFEWAPYFLLARVTPVYGSHDMSLGWPLTDIVIQY